MNIDSNKACKIISCDPTIERLKELSNEHNIINEHFEIIKEKCIKIEIKLHKLNIYRRKEVKIGTVIYLLNLENQEKINEMMNCSSVSISNLCKILKYKKKSGTLQKCNFCQQFFMDNQEYLYLDKIDKYTELYCFCSIKCRSQWEIKFKKNKKGEYNGKRSKNTIYL